jgi:methylmalonyl-CoA/ethylmalonyl-CoA epimerase
MKIHHLGIAVKDIESSALHYRDSLGWERRSQVYIDDIQQVKVLFMGDNNRVLYELIEPIGKDSPVSHILSKRISLYHFCYIVNDLNYAIQKISKNNFVLITGPVEAAAFNGKRIAFMINSDNLIIELLEK